MGEVVLIKSICSLIFGFIGIVAISLTIAVLLEFRNKDEDEGEK